MNETYKENRELSWLQFNDRVLNQAKAKEVPLGERLSFAAIYQSNLDEFFMVRIGSLYDEMLFYPSEKENKTGMTAQEQLKACLQRIHYLNRKKDKTYNDLMDRLNEYNIGIVKYKRLTQPTDKKYFEEYFNNLLLPLISPIIVSKRRPFPFLNNRELYVMAQLESKKGNRKMGIISCGNALTNTRLIPVPSMSGKFILVEDLILHFSKVLFSKYTVKSKALIRITRSADIDEDDYMLEGNDNYRDMMEDLIKQRRKLAPLRLEMSEGLDEIEVLMAMNFLHLKKNQVFTSTAPLDFKFIGPLRDYVKSVHPELFYLPLDPRNSTSVENKTSMIKQIIKKDIFLSYPYESMSPFLRLLNEASNDPKVVNIKMTLYRVAKDSKIVQSLIQAAENGKEVVVLVELRARFDEENNIDWSKRLEDAGCHVIYGLEGFKVHSKLCLITYNTGKEIQYISQIGTGNYNENTSKLYTDFSLMTANYKIGEEINSVFNNLSMGEIENYPEILLAAPRDMINRLMIMCNEQIELAKQGKEAYIGFKCNALTSKHMIEKLIEASQAGVKVEMIVRGISCLTPGVKGFTDNIRIISIVGRYLEHSRLYIFGTGDAQRIYISSADLMTRNLERRVEIGVEILDQDIKRQIISMFNIMLHDNVKSHEKQNDGRYRRVRTKEEKMNSQEYFFKSFYIK